MIGAATLAEKIVARAAGRARVEPGEIVTARVDLAMMHDSGGPRRVAPILERLGAPIWDPARVALVIDHYLPADLPEAAEIVARTRRFGAAEKLGNVFDGEGICHVVVPERGLLRPGMFAVGGDSHSPTGGAWGAFMFGIGATEMAGVLATGEIWLEVPETIRIELTGRLTRGVTAKDVMLMLCGRLGMGGGKFQAVEYGGEAVAALPQQERMTLSNMTAEIGGQTGLVPPDAITAAALRAAGVEPGDWSRWSSDAAAKVLEHHVFDAAALAPQVAAPHSPANARPIEESEGLAIDTAYVGACTGAKLVDLRMAAEVLRGRRAAPGVRLLVAPASVRDQRAADADGTLAVLVEAGAEILPNACGICAGYGTARFADGEVAISSTARNFRGRMGDDGSRVHLASPYTVAASAITGRITDPRPLLEGSRP